MNRRIFLTWIGLGFLASISPIAIAALIDQNKHHLASNSLSKGLKPVRFYVAPNGNDSWSGQQKSPNSARKDGPFATLHRARDAIRELKRQQGGTLQQPITVFLRDGTYFLSEPLIFTPEDSGTPEFPVTYRAYKKEKPVISGGKPITDWKQQGNLWVANLPKVKTGKWYFRLLRVGEDWAIRARYPNFDPKNPLKGGWLYVYPNRGPLQKGAFNSGVGYIYNIGDKLEWNIFAPAPANYRVWLRYANNMKNVNGTERMDDRSAISLGNSEPVPLRNLPDTGNWNNFRWTLAAKIDLSAGKQTLVWQNIKGGSFRLDAFCLTDDPDWSPATAISISQGGEAQIQQPQPGKHLIVVHAETYTNSIAKDLRLFPETSLGDRIPIAPAKFPNWQSWEGAEVNAFMKWNYGNSIFPVDSVDKKNHTLLGNFTNVGYSIPFGNRFWIENVREALDSPNEWYLDSKTGELFYWPKVSDFPNDVEVVAPVMDRLMVLQGDSQKESFVKHINFQGLTFRDTDYTLADNYFIPTDAAIWLLAARKCAIKDCTFMTLGGYGVRLDQKSHENLIISNQMAQLGGGGIKLAAKNTATQPFNNLIAANEIHDCGQVYKSVAGVAVSTGSGNSIVHNRIYRMPRFGISTGSVNINNYSRNNIIEFNEVIDSNLETSDTGGIYSFTATDKELTGNIIRFNFIRNVVGMGTTATGKILSPYYTWGIYLDAHTSGVKVYGNIVVGTVRGGVFINGGKDNLVENNIFIDGANNQLQIRFWDSGFAKNNVFRRNIIVYQDRNGTLWESLKKGPKAWQPNLISECDFNLYWHTGGLDLDSTQKAITPEGNFEQWQRAGFDRNSLIIDPLFVNLDEGDYRLKSNSPALKQLGFEQIPIEGIGIDGFKS